MEIIRSVGLERQVRAGEVSVRWDAWIGETLTAAAGITAPSGFPTRAQAARVSPTAPACVPQDHLEPVLLDHLRSLPAAGIRFGCELVALDQDEGCAAALLHDTESHDLSLVRARYVVAADGAHSAIRSQLGIPMEGPDRLVEHSTVLFRAPLWDVLGPRRHGLYVITNPQAAGVMLPVGNDDRWLYGQEVSDGRQGVHTMTEAELAHRLRAASGVSDLAPRIERVGHFSFAAKVASRYREHRAFLVGDAAHRVTPRGGTGMNTAIHDGFDLGWKLAWVARQWAAQALLESYEAERRPVGMRTTARSAEPDGSRDPAEALAADLGGRIPHAWLARADDRVSTLDLVGPGLTLLAHGDGGAVREALLPSSAPLGVHTLDPDTAEVLGIRPGGAMLLRPDAHPVAGWSTTASRPTDVDALVLGRRPSVPDVSWTASFADDAVEPALR